VKRRSDLQSLLEVHVRYADQSQLHTGTEWSIEALPGLCAQRKLIDAPAILELEALGGGPSGQERDPRSHRRIEFDLQPSIDQRGRRCRTGRAP
jgi:hypothetical protein